jgi:molybdopterin-binding protein
MEGMFELIDGAPWECPDNVGVGRTCAIFRTYGTKHPKPTIRVKSILSDKVLSEVIVETSIGEVASVITTRSVQEMQLKPGDKVFALVKATNVSLRRRS